MAEEVSLSDLPEPVLLTVVRRLSAAELACVLVQDKRLQSLCKEEALWRPHAQRRWPLCTADHYDGSWRALYCARAQLPLALPLAVDRCHHLTLQASGRQAAFNSSSLPGSPAASPAASPARINVYGVAHRPHTSIPGMLFADVMQQVYNVGLAASQRGITSAARRCLWPQDSATQTAASSSSASASAASSAAAGSWQLWLSSPAPPSTSSRDAAGSGSAMSGSSSSRSSRWSCRELALHYQDLTWWLNTKPEALFEFVRATTALLNDYDPWAGGWRGWGEVPWRRSAAQFLADALGGGRLGGGGPGVCASLGDRLTRDLARLDGAIRSIEAEACDLALHRPPGVPVSHWWWGVTGQPGAPCC